MHPVTKLRRNRKAVLVYIMGGKCYVCGYNRCLRAMQFHHVDPSSKTRVVNAGITKSFESDIEELRKCALVCNRCHSEITEWNIDVPITFDEERYQEVLHMRNQPKQRQPQKKCERCGAPISSRATICKDCFRNKCEVYPSREELKELIRTKPFVQIGKAYGVSYTAVKKWCKKYSLPYRKCDIDAITDVEWITI